MGKHWLLLFVSESQFTKYFLLNVGETVVDNTAKQLNTRPLQLATTLLQLSSLKMTTTTTGKHRPVHEYVVKYLGR